MPRQAWRAAIDGDGMPREGAQVAELTGYLPATLTGWPAGMRVIARRERPHPGARLRLTDDEGWRITCFATHTRGSGWTLPALEVRHRHPARRWEPKRLRFRLLAIAGRIVRSGRLRRLRLPRDWPWNDLLDIGWEALQPG